MTARSILALLVLLGLGLAGVVWSVEAKSPYALMATTAVVSLLLAASGIVERVGAVRAGKSRSGVESITARYMGLIWLWGAAALFTVYVFLMHWREWPHFFAAFAIAGLLALGFSALLSRDAAAGREDATLLQLGRYFALAQLAGMVATIAGLAIDPDKEFITTAENDWAGNGIFLFGASALAIVSAHALRSGDKRNS